MNRPKLRLAAALIVLLSLNLTSICWSLNGEGRALLTVREHITGDPFGALLDWIDSAGDIDHCSWSGVECCDGRVVLLNLKDLQLEGTLAPEIAKLTNLRSIILRNNSFRGSIPKEIEQLKNLQVLDLAHNNFTDGLPAEISSNLSMKTLNRAEGHIAGYRRLLQKELPPSPKSPKKPKQNKHKKGDSAPSPSPSPSNFFPISVSPESSFSPSPSPLSHSPSPSPKLAPFPASETPTESRVVTTDPSTNHVPTPSPFPVPNQSSTAKKSNQTHRVLIISAGVIGGLMAVLLSVFAVFFLRNSKMVPVKPWATGLSGQLQKAFVTGVPKLNRNELEAACEDFSNIIGNLSDGTVYKGTLSSGVEIAVTSTVVTSPENWSKSSETKFRNKIETLSKLNHKNFVNLIGFCEEEKPFTRMMVFEYAPNGTLFEHLHIKESEPLDFGMRLRIAMGIGYCLNYMHQLSPSISHRNLNSSSIQLTEDYAAKVSDFSFWNDLIASKIGTAGMELLETKSPDPQSNIHSFGLLLFEMITGRIPYSMSNDFLIGWASRFIEGDESSAVMVDPSLQSFDEDILKKLFEVVKVCLNPDTTQRPTIAEVTNMLKEITEMEPEAATPKVSPLWWAELEILTDST